MSLHAALNNETRILLFEVEAFLVRSGMSPSSFGREALKDPTFVFGLRKGQNFRPKTIDRVREFISRKRRAA